MSLMSADVKLEPRRGEGRGRKDRKREGRKKKGRGRKGSSRTAPRLCHWNEV